MKELSIHAYCGYVLTAMLALFGECPVTCYSREA